MSKLIGFVNHGTYPLIHCDCFQEPTPHAFLGHNKEGDVYYCLTCNNHITLLEDNMDTTPTKIDYSKEDDKEEQKKQTVKVTPVDIETTLNTCKVAAALSRSALHLAIEGKSPSATQREVSNLNEYVIRLTEDIETVIAYSRQRAIEPRKAEKEAEHLQYEWRDFKSGIAEGVIAVAEYFQHNFKECSPAKRLIRHLITGCEIPEADLKTLSEVLEKAGVEKVTGTNYPLTGESQTNE